VLCRTGLPVPLWRRLPMRAELQVCRLHLLQAGRLCVSLRR